jgi:adenylosuccinate synthase
VLHHASAQYEVLPGWSEDISQARSEADLPQNARDYLQYVSDFVGVPIAVVGVGPGRDQIIWLPSGAGSITAPAAAA